MPASVMQRAEKVLMNISDDLRNIQAQAYTSQDRIAKQIHKGYVDQKWVLYRKPAMEALSIGAYLVVAYDPSKLMQKLGTTDRKEALDFLSRVSGAVTSVAVEPSNISVQANLQRLNLGQAELTNFLNNWPSVIQAHDAALQRLQNVEGTNRQGG
jgi:hypothetical protein